METQNLLLYLHAANVDCTVEALHKLVIQESMVRSMLQAVLFAQSSTASTYYFINDKRGSCGKSGL